MGTKVKGEAIKEGSIPLSALSNEVKDKIENAGGGADWSAAKGEAGYIKNKPFKFYYENTEVIIPNNFLKAEDFTHEEDENGNITYTSKNIFQSEVLDVFYKCRADINTDYVLEGSFFSRATSNVYGHYVIPGYNNDIILYNKWDEDGETLRFVIESGQEDVFSYKIYVNNSGYHWAIETLPEVYLPNTVLKTTPQTLSDTDKNQALANLGIDPIVWKYMCEPYIIESESRIPDYLHQLLVNNNPLILNLCKIKVVTEIYDEYADAIRPIIHLCTPIAYKFNDEPDRALSLQCITFYDNTYHTYYVDIDESDGQIYDITEIVPNENNS